ncbi:8-oxoguanine DNA glycosylase [Novymonas esmeraldas]|uniref:DNA-(apurinic or apyrimidinic site) lyase n=1 Tax=Novymonas esmeraldas TaxID=1808958 RepID=A0AAW0F6K6_9TRYP
MAASSTAAVSTWRVLSPSRRAAVNLSMTLCGGQCFHWYATPRRTFVGAIGHDVFELREMERDATAPPPRVSDSPLGQSRPAPAPSPVTDTHPLGGCDSSWVEYRRLWPPPDPALLDGISGNGKRSSRTHARPGPSRTTAAIKETGDEDLLSHYLSLDVDLPRLWRRWTDSPLTRRHPLVTYLIGNRRPAPPPTTTTTTITKKQRDVAATAGLGGVYVPIRHVRQDLHSCLFSFLCSQNNNVTRITGMVYALCRAYGDHLCDVDIVSGNVRAPSTSPPPVRRPRQGCGTAPPKNTVTSPPFKASDFAADVPAWLPLYSFPSVAQLTAATEAELRELGFGYRSKYIVDAVRLVAETPPATAVAMATPVSPGVMRQHETCVANHFYAAVLSRHGVYREQRDMLMALPGVGRKVADCVALFSLSCRHIVPVDTHMAQIAVEYLTDANAPATTARSPPSLPVTRKRRRDAPGTPVECDGGLWNGVLLEWGRQSVAMKEKKNKAAAGTATRTQRGGESPPTQRTVDKAPVPALYERHHDAIQGAFAALFGDHAGWAHSIFFYYRMRK